MTEHEGDHQTLTALMATNLVSLPVLSSVG